MKKNKGYIALSLAIMVSIIVMGAITYLMNQGEIVSKQFVKHLQADRKQGILKEYVTKTAAAFRKELYEGVNPISPTSPPTGFLTSELNIDFKCKINPDLKDPTHLYIEPNPPSGTSIVYTCKELTDPNKAAILTAYFKNSGTIDTSQKSVAYISYELPIGDTIEAKGLNIDVENILVPGLSSGPFVTNDPNGRHKIYLHDIITTSNAEYIRTYLRDKTYFHIGPNSKFHFKKFIFKTLQERHTIYQLFEGSIQAVFKKLTGAKKITIETPTVALGIRGTEIALDVKETINSFHVTLDVIHGEVEVFDKDGLTLKIVGAGESFNHFQKKNPTLPGPSSGFSASGEIRPSLKPAFYIPLPTPVPVVTPTGGGAPSVAFHSIHFITGKEQVDVIESRREALLLYAYLHNANRNKNYFSHIKAAGGWKQYLKQLKPSTNIDNTPLFIPQNAKYSNMEFGAGSSSPANYSYLIAMMPPNNISNSYTTGLKAAMIFDAGATSIGPNNSFLLFHQNETLQQVVSRLDMGEFSALKNNLAIVPLTNIVLQDGKIKGCTGSDCNTIQELLQTNPMSGGSHTGYYLSAPGATPQDYSNYSPSPTPVPTPAPTPTPTCTTYYKLKCNKIICTCGFTPCTQSCGTDPTCAGKNCNFGRDRIDDYQCCI